MEKWREREGEGERKKETGRTGEGEEEIEDGKEVEVEACKGNSKMERA